MLRFFKNVIRDENGAVTVDWVVLCAGVVVIAVAIVAAMQTGVLTLTDGVTAFLSRWSF